MISPTGVSTATLLTPNLIRIANCGAPREETVQQGAETQLNSAESDGACPDAPMESMAALFGMPCIGAPLEGRQQFAEELPSAQIL